MSEKLKNKPGKPSAQNQPVNVSDDSKKINIPNKEIGTIQMFFEEILKLRAMGFTFFRGDKKVEDYKLIPNIFKGANYKLSDIEDIMIDEFTSLSVNKNMYNTNSYIEEMLMAQHYELPTRLQDWSESALTALYFSVFENDEKDRKFDSYLWALNPEELNKHINFLDKRKLVPNIISSSIDKDVEDKINEFYVKENDTEVISYPIALNARKINPRIEAQRGVFVFFPRQKKLSKCICLTKYDDSENFLFRFDIKKDVAATFLNYLQNAGINQYLLFPEMRSIAKDIKAKYEKKVK